MPVIEIIISPDGHEVNVDGQDFKGTSCAKYEEAITAALGKKTDGNKKPSFYEKEGAWAST